MRTLTGVVSASISFALVISCEAGALELPLAGASVESDKDLSVFVGLAVGTDSNVTRSATAVDDVVTETKLGMKYQRDGKTKLLIGAEATNLAYGDNSQYDAAKTEVVANAIFGSDKFRAGVGVGYGDLKDPVDVAIEDLAERTELSYAPSMLASLSAVGIGLAFSNKDTAYDTASYQYLDNTDSALNLDVTFGKNSSPSKFFVHVDSGSVEFPDNSVRSDFDYMKFYGGYRGGKAGVWGVEVSAGTSSFSGFSNTSGLSVDAPYVMARFTKLLKGGRSGIDIVYLQDGEAAATAEMKTVNRMVARYSQSGNNKWGWLASYTSEKDEFETVDSPGTSPTSLTLAKYDIGLQRELGSPGKMHGRLYLTIQGENRTADTTGGDYDKLRITFGGAAVY